MGKEAKWGGGMKVNMRRVTGQRAGRCRQNERRLAGGMQLANHRGSRDAGLASYPFSRGWKLKVHGLIVPIKPHANMLTQTTYAHMHSHPTSGKLPVCMPVQVV